MILSRRRIALLLIIKVDGEKEFHGPAKVAYDMPTAGSCALGFIMDPYQDERS
jgi:hypothetical protein